MSRVSSAAISAASRSVRSARLEMSSRLPIGVATRKSVPTLAFYHRSRGWLWSHLALEKRTGTAGCPFHIGLARDALAAPLLAMPEIDLDDLAACVFRRRRRATLVIIVILVPSLAQPDNFAARGRWHRHANLQMKGR